jgi:flagellar biosynthesis protein FliR
MDWLDINVLTFQYFILVFARLVSMVGFSPIIGSGSVPVQAKVGFSFLLSLIVFPIVSRDFPAMPEHIIMFWVLIFREVLVGMLIGVIGNLMFSAVQISGQIFGMQLGFGIVNVIDPLSDTQIALLGQFEFIVAILLFLAMNGHHALIKIIANSYTVVPLGSFSFTESLGMQVAGWLSKCFEIALKIGLPVIMILLMVSVGLGIIARTVPQMNVFMVGLPLKIFVGLWMMMITMGLMAYLLRGYFDQMFKDVVYMMRLAGGTL